jgi:glycosyltransferase involved in cell wall biosynthesis
LIVPEIFSSEGGIPRILQLYLRALCDLVRPEDQIRLIALNDREFNEADLHRVNGGRVTESKACGRSKIRFVRATMSMGQRSDYLLCGHVAQLPAALAACALNPRLKYDLIAHGVEVWRPLRLLERVALRRARRVFCVSDHTRRELLRRCPLPEGRAIVLPNALDPAFPIRPGAPRTKDTPPTILLVARLTRFDREKGVADMIKAMPAVTAALPGTRLRIIGRGDELPQLIALSRELGTQDSVEFLGYVNDHDMTEALRTCTLFALPSRKEGFGLVFIEAMACGRPCLGARAGGIPEVITPEAGVLVGYGDVAGIANACIDALQRQWDEDAILARAREFAYPRFKGQLGELLSA